MPVFHPQKTVHPTAIRCGDTATVTIRFDAAASMAQDPADIILILDRSCCMCPPRLEFAKEAAHALIDTIAAASGGTMEMENNTRMGLVSFASSAQEEVQLTKNTTLLHNAVRALTYGGAVNHKAALEAAENMLPRKGTKRQIIILFTGGITSAGDNPNPAAERMKAAGIEIFCIGLLSDPVQLNRWASKPTAEHVAYTDNPANLKALFKKTAYAFIPSGARDPILKEEVREDFRITNIRYPVTGTARITGTRTITWNPGTLGLLTDPETATLSFDIVHVGSKEGVLPVNASLTYEDQSGNSLHFPNPAVNVSCGGTIYPEPCPVPTDFKLDSCQDSLRVTLADVTLLSTGRIAQLDVTLRDICPGKRVAVSILLMEYDSQGKKYPRGAKHILVPGHGGTTCQDITLRCIPFSIPEALDPSGSGTSLCNPRKFSAQVIANYVDTDFSCCAEGPVN